MDEVFSNLIERKFYFLSWYNFFDIIILSYTNKFFFLLLLWIVIFVSKK